MRNDQAAVRAVPGKSGDRVPFNDLLVQWREISADVEKDFAQVFATSAFSRGAFVEAFESDVASYLGVRHAVAVNSGTSALHLAMVALDLGVGDEVLVPAHTFIATLWGPLYVGAKPILCDVEGDTATIDVADAERRITPRTRAIIPVHLYGQPANMDAVMDLAGRYGLAVVEDNAQAFGARWNGRPVGTHGKLGCFSFYPGKSLGAAGEGGLVSTDDDGVAKRVRSLHNHGQNERYVHEMIGFNHRMDGLQGVILRHKLRRIDDWTARRKALAKRYQDGLAGLPVEVPVVRNQDHIWHLFVIRTPQRDALRAHLEANGIETGLHYPIPNHRQPCLRHLEMDRDSFPNSDRWAQRGLSLPLFYGMTIAQLDRVVQAIREFFKT